MKRSLLGASFCVALFAIGCQSSNDQTAAKDNAPAGPSTTTTGAAATTGGAATAGTTAATTGATADNSGAAKTGYPAVQAIFSANCMPCHGGGGKRGPAAGFDASSYEGVMKGGRDGSMVTASDPDKSQLVDYLKGTKKPQMPMKRPPLSDADMKVITDWIKAGAKNS